MMKKLALSLFKVRMLLSYKSRLVMHHASLSYLPRSYFVLPHYVVFEQTSIYIRVPRAHHMRLLGVQIEPGSSPCHDELGTSINGIELRHVAVFNALVKGLDTPKTAASFLHAFL